MWQTVRRACAAAMALITAIAFADVIGRYLFARTLPGGYDVALRLQAFAIFWGIALAGRERAHIRVDLILELLGARGAARVQRFSDFCTALFFALAGAAGLAQLPKLYASGERLAGIDLPAWPFFLLATIGLALAAPAAWFAPPGAPGEGGVEAL